MILSMSPFLFVHVLLSLTGIVSGLVILCGLVTSEQMDGWTAVFLFTALPTSVTTSSFPFTALRPRPVWLSFR